MKKLISITSMIFAIVLLWYGCTKPEKTGTIYGTVTDQATGEPVKSAGVELLPIGLKTVTGSDGTFQFPSVEYGEYELYVTKTGYESTKKSGIQLKGTSAQYDVQIAKLPAALRVVDDSGNDISEIDFGSESGDLSRLFNIFNDSESALEWQITKTADWITVSETSGTLLAGVTKGIIVVIDRNLLQQGENITTLHVTSDNGNKQLTIKAIGGTINTLDATSVTEDAATLQGSIIRDIPYTEKGFMYGSNHDLNNKIVVEGNGVGNYSCRVFGLDPFVTYQFKAYCVWNGTYYYGEEKEFGPYYDDVAYFQYGGNTYMVAPDPGSGMMYADAYSYCDYLTLYGYSNWKMPTREELVQMYNNRIAIGGFANEKYWTSDNVSGTYFHYVINFINGAITDEYPYYYFRVRPIRVCQ
jgi:hypothetical protein